MNDEQTPPATEPAPLNPVSHLLIELSRVFAAVPQTVEDERAAYIRAQVEIARFVGGRHARPRTWACGRHNCGYPSWHGPSATLTTGGWPPCCKGQSAKPEVPQMAASSGRSAFGSWPSNTPCTSLEWPWRRQQRTSLPGRPDLKRLMTRGKNLPDTILNWRRKLEEAQSGDFLWKFSRQMLDMEETLRRLVQSTEWRQRAYILLARIRP